MTHRLSAGDDLVQERLRINIELEVPGELSSTAYEAWSTSLLERDSWRSVGVDSSALKGLPKEDELFVISVLVLYSMLMRLGYAPVFDLPRVLACKPSGKGERAYALDVLIPAVQFIDPKATRMALQAALQLCKWMAAHPVTPKHCDNVFRVITQKVIKPLRQMIPGGKSTIPVLTVAHDMDIPLMHLGLGIYQLGWGAKARRLDRSVSEMDSAMGSRLAQSKPATAHLLRAAGLPAPVHEVVGSEEEALAAATRVGFPVVVKPADRDRGEGVSVDVESKQALQTAFAAARALSKSGQVIVERQVPGVCHRLFMTAGRLLYAVKRWPMSVMGDGHGSVKELVDAEVARQMRRPPWLRSEIRPLDDMGRQALARAGFDEQSVPANGVMVPLRRIETTEWGGVDEEVTQVVHPDNVAAAARAAQLFGLHTAGIDIISSDISVAWHHNSAIINEVNFAPLFGGGEISRSYIAEFLAELMQGDGRIPIDVFDSEEAALAKQADDLSKGLSCFYTSATRTLDASQSEIVMPFDSVRPRVKALICRPDVDAIVVAHPRPIA